MNAKFGTVYLPLEFVYKLRVPSATAVTDSSVAGEKHRFGTSVDSHIVV